MTELVEPTSAVTETASPDSARQSIVADFALAALRFVLSAWVGAAVLFVITSVAEQTSPNFGMETRDQLATVRFPLYYMFGFAVHALSLVAVVLFRMFSAAGQRGRANLLMMLVVISSAMIWYDHVNVYRPLQDLIIPAGQPRTEDFKRLHQLSAYLNSTHIFVMLVAASIAVLPRSRQA